MNVGLLALSGIRVVDDELVQLGLTLPGFVERSEVIASLPSLGLLTLAALTPTEHGVTYLEIPDPRALDELPDGFDEAIGCDLDTEVNDLVAGAFKHRRDKILPDVVQVTFDGSDEYPSFRRDSGFREKVHRSEP